MQVVLFYSVVGNGKYVTKQRKIAIGTLLTVMALTIFKYWYMTDLEPTLTERLTELDMTLKTLGYNTLTLPDGTVVFDYWRSLEFEVFSILISSLLLHYYQGQILSKLKDEPYHYVHHSEWLSQYMTLYHLFFLTLTLDTFFAQTIIQMVVLGLMFLIMFLWAIESSKKNLLINFVVVWVKRILAVQLAVIALMQIAPILQWTKDHKSLYDILFVLGLIFDNDQPKYQSVTHVFLLGFIICFNHLYDATYQNYVFYQKHKNEFIRTDLKESLLKKKDHSYAQKKSLIPKAKTEATTAVEDDPLADDKPKRGGMLNLHRHFTEFDYKKFVASYLPYLCLWVNRGCSLILAYAYHGTPAFLVLSWLLLSFMIPLVNFITCTVFVYLPIFSVGFFFEYFINISGIFKDHNTIYPEYAKLFSDFGRPFKVAPIEVGGMALNLCFLFIMMGSKKDLQLQQRSEFKHAIFKKLTNPKSNFLWQLSYYIFKRIHIPLLSLIFAFGLQEINIYYIGLLYFFVMYTSSLATYRKSGITLIAYASFFIWIQYLWSLTKGYFDKTSFIAKIFTMITLQKYDANQEITGADAINKYMEYQIPVSQWLILMLHVLMSAVNSFFKKDKKFVKPSLENPNVLVKYESTSQFYEDKCDFVLTMKFPRFAKFLIRISMIFSEIMILVILIVQGYILAYQDPNIMFWGFLIFSLTLQTAVVSASEENVTLLTRCVNQSKILKIYSGVVLISQIAYHFITDKNFLAQYGFNDILATILGGINDYMAIIGFKHFGSGGEKQNVAAIFLSPILFFITATILEDYFSERIETVRKREHEEAKLIAKELARSNSIDPLVKQQTIMNMLASALPIDKDDEDVERMSLKDQIHFQYDKIRFSIPYMIYQRMAQWRLLDSIALNFHLVTATITMVLCTNWQISLFMSFYLLCTVILCIRAARELHRNGQSMQVEQWNSSQDATDSRNGIKGDYITKEAISVDEAHQLNKKYMFTASQTLLKVRKGQWQFQYWLLILSMIIMYPTPIMSQIKTMHPQFKEPINNAVYWLFWGGIYVSPKDLNTSMSHAPLYAMIIMLIMEKIAQRWQNNRYGCSIYKIREFKTLEEQLRLIEKQQEPSKINDESLIAEAKPSSEFITVQEARQECERIESLYRLQTDDILERRLHYSLELGIKRKYTIQFRNAMKFIMEQVSLQLLLLSCANKSNFVSILYLGLLLMFLLIKNKTTGMFYMSYAFGLTLAFEYLLSLVNLTPVNSPMKFPFPWKNYPCNTNPTTKLADCSNLPEFRFWFPWFLSNEFFAKNLDWAMFFSIDVEFFQVNDIWFDFANLALLTVYFFNFGNPINAKSTKVSFSQTRRLEDDLNSYSRIQMKKKFNIKKGIEEIQTELIADEANDDAEGQRVSNYKSKIVQEESFNSEKAADDSQEYFLGSTYYLNEMKQRIFIYYFTKKMRYFTFIGVQLITFVMIFLLAFLCRSLMSLGYMITCIPLIWHMVDFFNLEQLQQSGKKWRHPYLICGPLMIFSFVDISLQILFQVPFYDGTYFQRLLGFDKIYDINPDVTAFADLMKTSADKPPMTFATVNVENLAFLVLKSLNLFFIFLQSRIYESEDFWKFMRNDLRRLLSIGNHYKKLAITYRYNNWKLQKIITLQQRKKKMYEGVAELKMKIQLWQSQQQNLLRGTLTQNPPTLATTPSALNNLKTPLLEKIDEEEQHSPHHESSSSSSNFNINTSTQQQPIEQQQPQNRLLALLTQRASNLKISERKISISQQLGNNFKMGQLNELLEKDDDYFEKKESLKELKTKVGRCGRIYFWLKKNHVNEILLINDIEEAQKIKKDTEKGYRTIRNDLEKTMISDINLIYEAKRSKLKAQQAANGRRRLTIQQIKSMKESIKINLNEMTKTQDFLKAGNIIAAVFGAAFEAMFSKMDSLSYCFMILSMILNAGLISIVYPFAVFGYALMEEGRPGKAFWRNMTIYTLAILFIKFIVQLQIWHDFGFDETYTSINSWIMFGLWRVEGIAPLLGYIIPEILVLACIMGQTYYENLIGLYDKKEIEIENVSQARERFMNSFQNINTGDGSLTIRKPKAQDLVKEVEELDDDGKNYEQRLHAYPSELAEHKAEALSQRRVREYEEMSHFTIKQEVARKELTDMIDDYEALIRQISFIDDKEDRHAKGKALKHKRQPPKKNWVKKFSSRGYFQRLFPLIKEQKPGVDLYVRITLIQFVICWYLISYYTHMDARGTQNLENTSQFSIYMVVMLFIQVAVMILERYISRTNTRVNKKGGNAQKKLQDLDDKYMQNMQMADAPRSMTMNIQQQKTSDTILFGKDQKSVLAAQHEDYLNISLTETKMTSQQVSKWLIQWILLILYHAVVFWIFPLSSNDAIYGKPYCDTNSTQYAKYGCFNFKQNGYLVIFYLIFCYYFMMSALQIRHGYPDWRAPSALTGQINKLYHIGNLIFYNLPFLVELKTILDWCFTKTSLDLFQWLELAEINVAMFNNRNSNKSYFERKLGEVISKCEKWICGCFCLTAILFFLVGPFLFFSNLSYIAQQNPVKDAVIDFTIKITEATPTRNITFEFPIFYTDSPISMQSMSESQFNNRTFNIDPETKFFEPEQVQYIKMMNASDNTWSISEDYKVQFAELMDRAYKNVDDGISVQFIFSYTFYRDLPALTKVAHGQTVKVLDPIQDKALYKGFYDALTMDCKSNRDQTKSIYVNDFIPYHLRVGEKVDVTQLHFDKENATLTYSCEDYWAFNVNLEGLAMIIFNDLVSSGFFSQSSIMGFYLGVALLVGSTLRKIVMYNTDRIFICDIPNSDAVRNLIECIYLQRLEQNLKKEEELFFILFEILRSPEMLKALTGSSLRVKLNNERSPQQLRNN